jgi:hypothetical protein
MKAGVWNVNPFDHRVPCNFTPHSEFRPMETGNFT